MHTQPTIAYIFEDAEGLCRLAFTAYENAFTFGDQYLFDQGVSNWSERRGPRNELFFFSHTNDGKKRIVGRILEMPLHTEAFPAVCG